MSTKQNYKNNSADKNKNGKPTKPNIMNLLPIIFILAIYPFITHFKEYNASLSQFSWFSQTDITSDFFLYYKQNYFIVISIIMVIIIAYRAYNNKKIIKFTYLFIPLSIYALLAFLSSLFTKYRSYAFTGTYGQYESVFALLGYCLIVYYIYLFVHTEEDIRLILYYFIISIIIMSLIGLTQILGHDFFTTSLGKRLITPSALWNTDLSFNFPGSWVYLTLYNPNYAGVYAGLILPVLFFLIIFTKKKKQLLMPITAFILLSICLIGANSLGSIIGIIITTLLIIVLLWRYLFKYYYITIPAVLIVLLVVSIYNFKNDNILINKIVSIVNLNKTEVKLNDIQTNNDHLLINYMGNTMKIQLTGDEQANNFIIKDASSKDIPYTIDSSNGAYVINDNRFPSFVLTPFIYQNELSFNVLIDGKQWPFTNKTKDGSYYYINRYGKLDKIVKAPSILFKNHENFANYRGYIWSRSIPLLKDHIILGSGADTYVLEFPHRDYVNLYNNNFTDQLLTKPHNMYLQIAIQTGVLSLIAFVLFYILYFISSLKLYIKGNFNNFYSQIGAGIMAGTFCYMVSGMVNDSSIAVAPIFWIFVGLGIVVNSQVKKINQNI